MQESPYTKTEFHEDLERLHHAAWEAKTAYQIWFILMNKDERPKYGKVLQRYSHFFGASIRAQFLYMLMALCKIYDKEHGRHLRKLIKMSVKASFIPKDFADLIESEILKLKPVISKLHLLRNNFYAHIQLASRIAYKKADITPNDFRHIIDSTIDFLDRIAVASGTTRPKFQMAEQITYKLLDVLKKDLEG